MEAPNIVAEFHDAAERYGLTGRATFDEDRWAERRLHQCPTVFGLPSLAAKPFWSVEELGRSIDAEVVRAMSAEYHRHCQALRVEPVTQDVKAGTWDAACLMTEGRWEFAPSSSAAREMFAVTASVLASLDVFETGLGYVYFSRLTAGTVIRPHCGVTNCKLRMQIVLFDEAEMGAATDIGGRSRLGRLTVDGETREYRAGEVMVFDDSFVHSVDLTGAQTERVVLLVDVWHPELCGGAFAEVRSGVEGVFPPSLGEVEDATAMAVVAAEATTVAAAVAAVAAVATIAAEEVLVAEGDAVAGGLANEVPGSADVAVAAAAVVASAAVAEAVLHAEATVDTDDDARMGAGSVDPGRAEELPTKTLNALKVANAALDRYEHDAATAATRVVSARDVFVSRPESGEPYAGHPRAIEYAKGLQLLSDEPKCQHHFLLRLLMLGDCGAGKSSYLQRLADRSFVPEYVPTIGVDFKIVHRGFCDPVLPMSVESSPVGMRIHIWETVGPEEYRTLAVSYYRGASGYFLFFDVAKRESFENTSRWVSHLRQHGCGGIPAVLIGMKQDIAWPGEVVSSPVPMGGKDEATAATASEASGACRKREQYRQVSYDEGLAMAQQFDMPYVECSAKDDVHIEDALATLVYHIVRSRADLQRGVQDDILMRPVGPRGNGGATAGGADGSRRQCVVS